MISMSKIINPLAMALLAAGLATARPFTNSAGKTIEAEIGSATATTVTLKLPSGRKAKVQLSILSAADQNKDQRAPVDHDGQTTTT